ncbi:hypothetical protein L210DRAFT_3503824 [Boletus edulis BED1]|uniref:Uncharacterized protein n=1 Tax=Boletus edulis BED1 TaxID=1328754 RepID=A0AAD4BVC7_BOLED|nr:hypothetical protein L210DRAFT_3503824 [Boletus edulis BED1]
MDITWTEFGTEDDRFLPPELRYPLQKWCSAWHVVEKLLLSLIRLRRDEQERPRAELVVDGQGGYQDEGFIHHRVMQCTTIVLQAPAQAGPGPLTGLVRAWGSAHDFIEPEPS